MHGIDNNTIKGYNYSMTKIITAVIVAFLSLSTLPAQANNERVIAIIDTAIDSSKFTNVVHEVCITTLSSCPNGLSHMEGPGSANISNWNIRSNQLVRPNHGNAIAIIATKVDPSVKIVFIRIMEGNVSFIAGSGIANALKWVEDNHKKYSIDAVSISQNMTGNTCSTRFVGPESSVKNLYSNGVAVFSSSGNNSNRSLFFPSCVTNAYSVGAMYKNSMLSSSNGGMSVKFAAQACFQWKPSGPHCVESLTHNNFTVPSIVGTSAATIIAATKVLLNSNGLLVTEYINSLPTKNALTLVQ